MEVRDGNVTGLSIRAASNHGPPYSTCLIAIHTYSLRKPVCTQIPGLVWIRLADCARFSKYRKVMKYRERCETFNARSGGLLAPPPSSPFLSLPTTYIEYTWPCISRASTHLYPAWGGADNFFIKKVFRNKNQTRSSVGIDTRPPPPAPSPLPPHTRTPTLAQEYRAKPGRPSGAHKFPLACTDWN